jgi:hypothetical protein
VHQLNDLLANCEAETSALILSAHRTVDLLERLEKLGDRIWRDADAAVLDIDRDTEPFVGIVIVFILVGRVGRRRRRDVRVSTLGGLGAWFGADAAFDRSRLSELYSIAKKKESKGCWALSSGTIWIADCLPQKVDHNLPQPLPIAHAPLRHPFPTPNHLNSWLSRLINSKTGPYNSMQIKRFVVKLDPIGVCFREIEDIVDEA